MNTLDDYRELVFVTIEESTREAGLLGLANILKSIMVNMELSEEDRREMQILYDEIMEQERLTNLPQE